MPDIFISAPYFPPSAMPPAQRIRLLVKHLHEFGWKPFVFTVDPYYREDKTDPWMLEIAGNDYEQITLKAWDQRKSRKFGIGDLGIRMFFHLYRSLKKETKKKKPALLLYPVPPWYIMVMAPWIKRMTGIPFAIDYIDPWIFQVENRNLKARISQWIARLLEGHVIKHSSAVFAVSEGILKDLLRRYPEIGSKPLVPVPYGVEVSDFDKIRVQKGSGGKVVMRYTGAVSEKMLPVIQTLFKAIRKMNPGTPLQVIFTGTSYAGAGLVKPLLSELIRNHDLQGVVIENPARVGYREALELNMSADIQLLIGDTTPYYAASKLMGIVASGQPFFAFLNKDSFPARFLAELNFADQFCFFPEQLNDDQLIDDLVAALDKTIGNRDHFIPVDRENPVFMQHSAKAMTKTFVDNFQKIIHE
jgi:glycosyltransferase involved in cell wall biosynthesis